MLLLPPGEEKPEVNAQVGAFHLWFPIIFFFLLLLIAVESLVWLNVAVVSVILGLSCCIVIIAFRDVGVFFLLTGGGIPGESSNIPIV